MVDIQILMVNTLTMHRLQKRYKRLLLFFPKLVFPFAVLASLGLHGAVLMLPLEEKPEEEVVEEELIEDVPIAIFDAPSDAETKPNNKEIPLPAFPSPPRKTVSPVQPTPVKEEVVTEPTEVETVPDLDKKDDSSTNKSNSKAPISSDSEEDNGNESDDDGGDSGKKQVDKEAKTKAEQFVNNFAPTDSTGVEKPYFFEAYIRSKIDPLKQSKKEKEKSKEHIQELENQIRELENQIRELENQIRELENQIKLFFPLFDKDMTEKNWFEDREASIINIGLVPEKTLKEVFEKEIAPQLKANGSTYEKKDEGYAGGDLYQIKDTDYYIVVVQLKGPGKLVLWAYLDKSSLE